MFRSPFPHTIGKDFRLKFVYNRNLYHLKSIYIKSYYKKNDHFPKSYVGKTSDHVNFPNTSFPLSVALPNSFFMFISYTFIFTPIALFFSFFEFCVRVITLTLAKISFKVY